MIFRMLTGPFDIPNLSLGGDLGNRRLEATILSRFDRRIFAQRVNDNAENAHATLSFALGATGIQPAAVVLIWRSYISTSTAKRLQPVIKYMTS